MGNDVCAQFGHPHTIARVVGSVQEGKQIYRFSLPDFYDAHVDVHHHRHCQCHH